MRTGCETRVAARDNAFQCEVRFEPALTGPVFLRVVDQDVIGEQLIGRAACNEEGGCNVEGSVTKAGLAPESATDAPLAPPPLTPKPPVLQTLDKDQLVYGCSCTFHFADGQDQVGVACSGEVDESAYRIQLDGKTVTLTSESEGKDAQGRFVAPGLEMTLRSLSIRTCPEGMDECEGTRSARELVLTREGGSSTYRVEGTCGC